MARLARVAFVVLTATLGCAGVGVGSGLVLQGRAEAARDDRIASLTAALPDLRARVALAPADACSLVELHVLTRPLSRALAVRCERPALEPRGADVVRLTGAVWGGDLDNALFGGGHAQAWCLARTASGWEVVGDDWTVRDCVLDPSAGDAAAIAAASQRGLADRERAVALAVVEDTRRAAASAASPPAACVGLDPGPSPTVVVTGATLAGRASAGLERLLGYGTSGCVAAGDTPASPEEAVLRGTCGLPERPARVLLVEVDEALPVLTGADSFTGGHFAGTLWLVDLDAGRVLCARPVAYTLPDEVLTYKSSSVASEYDRGARRALCEAVAALGGARLDPYFACGE